MSLSFESVRKEFYRRLLERASRGLAERGWEAYVVESRGEARERALSLIPEDYSVGVPGSATVREVGLVEALKASGRRVVEHWIEIPAEERRKLMREEVVQDAFVHSPNAVTTDGEVVLLDWFGNRIAGTVLGPRMLVLIAGANKVVEGLDRALERAKRVAAEMNALRLGKRVEEIVSYMLVVYRAPPAIERKCILLVNEFLGF